MNTQQKVINQIKADLASENSSIVSKALVKTKAKGNEELIAPLVELYKTTEDIKLKQEVKKIFSLFKFLFQFRYHFFYIFCRSSSIGSF